MSSDAHVLVFRRVRAVDPAGSLDAVVDVYQRQRSQLLPVDCRTTDRNGRAALAFAPSPNATYVIRYTTISGNAAVYRMRATPCLRSGRAHHASCGRGRA